LSEVAGYAPRGMVEWSPTWGGMFVALGILLLLGTLGVAIGTANGTAGAIWAVIGAIIGFFVGGWFAGRTIGFFDSAVAGAHGFLVWAVSLVFTLLASIFTAFAGLNVVSGFLHALPISQFIGAYGVPSGAAAAAANTSNPATSAWIGFIVLVLTLIAAVWGAIVGNKGRHVEDAAPR
jgi:hypothetical protein